VVEGLDRKRRLSLDWLDGAILVFWYKAVTLVLESLFAGFGNRRSLKRRSPSVHSRWSSKVCKGQHDRRLMKRCCQHGYRSVEQRWA